VGQPVAVEERRGAAPEVLRFETNRSLTGQGHERFESLDRATGIGPAAVLARRFLESGQVSGVHVYSNVVTVTLLPGATGAGLSEIVRDLYQYWKPGMVPPSLEDLMAELPAEEAAAAPAEAGADGAARVDSRVPAHLLERSRAARARWEANR
jgi:hypothetical protein